MRLNIFFGIRNSTHIMRDLIKHDSRITFPKLPLFRIEGNNKEGFGDAVIRSGFSKKILETLFEDLTAQEANLANEQLNFDDIIPIVLTAANPGTRFIFWKPNDVDQFVKEHLEWIAEFEKDEFIMHRKNYGYFTLDPEPIKRRVVDNIRRLNSMADKMEASEWKVFNLKDYFSDEINAPTNVSIREYIKQ